MAHVALRDAIFIRSRSLIGKPWLYRGRRFGCPCCGSRFRRLRTYNGRRNARCPRCGSMERHRVLWLYLNRETKLTSGEQHSVLHFAPEKAISDWLAEVVGPSYLTADLDPERAMEVLDMTNINRPDESFDLILASHVLEHVPDDQRAMSELFRVLKPSGVAILQHPVDYTRETYEDWSLTSAEERERAFLQDDHVRIYGADLADRLKNAGFQVEIRRYREEFTPDERRYYCLDEGADLDRSDDIYVCTRPS
jgi:SAM-dependent methyltransferase